MYLLQLLTTTKETPFAEFKLDDVIERHVDGYVWSSLDVVEHKTSVLRGEQEVGWVWGGKVGWV